MKRHIQNKDGKMMGSISLGGKVAPTPQFMQRMIQEDGGEEVCGATIFDLWEESRRKQHEEELLAQEHNPADLPSIPVFQVGKGDIILIPAADVNGDSPLPARVTDTSSDNRDFIVRLNVENKDGVKHEIAMKHPHTVSLLSREPANGPWPPPYWAPERSKPHEAAEDFDEYEYEERRRALRTQTNSLPDEQEAVSNIQVEDVILVPSRASNDYQWIAAEVTGIRNESPYMVVGVRDYFGNEEEFSLMPENNISVARKGRGRSQEGWPSPGSDPETRIHALQLRQGDVIELDSTAPGGKQMVRIKSVIKHRGASGANETTVRAVDRNGRTNKIVFDVDHPLDLVERGPEPEQEGPDQHHYMVDSGNEAKFPTPADALVDFWSFLNNFGKKNKR